MSLFDDVLDGDGMFSEKQFGPQEAFAGVLLCATACDGHIADEEGRSLMLILSQRRLYQRLSEQQFGSMMDRLVGLLRKNGPEQLLAKCTPLVPPELRETVFANAVDIVMANGSVDSDEKEFVNDVATQLELDTERAKKIIKVMSFKNKG